MVIGIDFDNTLVNTKQVTKKYLDIHFPGNNLESYHDLSKEEEKLFFEKYYIQITKDLDLLPGVKKAFDYFKKNNIKTIMITARGVDYCDLIEPTKEFLKQNNIVFDKMIFQAPVKGDVCLDNNLDLFIDDSLNVIPEVSQKGVNVLLFGKESKEYPYALTWDEVINYIQKGL